LKEVMENNKALDEVIKNRIKKEEERVKIDSGNL
jgi:hypothetical protein